VWLLLVRCYLSFISLHGVLTPFSFCSWKMKLFVKHSKQVWLTGVALAATCGLVALIVGALHLQERVCFHAHFTSKTLCGRPVHLDYLLFDSSVLTLPNYRLCSWRCNASSRQTESKFHAGKSGYQLAVSYLTKWYMIKTSEMVVFCIRCSP
jgi:hypothetical protein